MNKAAGFLSIMIILLGLLIPKVSTGQDINMKIGFRDSIKSEIFHESRRILIHLPDNYSSSNRAYPVMYRLDGDDDLLFETVLNVDRLALSERVIPDMIIVAIENVDRFRDMFPVNTINNPKPKIAGAKEFLNFIETELIPYIDSKYRTKEDRILCGQSLSSLFTIYAFLTKPKSFNSYIAISGAFPDCGSYFRELSLASFQQIDQFNGQKLFITNGLKDEIDPDGEMNREMADFSNSVKDRLGDRITFKYLTYENGGHMPFYSLYDGLKFLYEHKSK